ncbi:MAG: ATPase domain-containing protein [Thermoplasmatales archaeon]|nr:ATPase domain-containing protein [Thermoplasmatales archaeon]
MKTGIDGLNSVASLTPGVFCLINGSPMSGRNVLAQEIFYKTLKSDEGAVYVATNDFAEEIINKMSEKKWYLSPDDKYVFVDTYSVQSNPSINDTENIKYVPSTADFAKLSSAILSSMSDFTSKDVYEQKIVFDSVDSLLMYVSPQSVYRFLSYLRAKIKTFKAGGFFLLQPDLHDEKAVKTIVQLADVLINIDDKKNELNILSPNSSPKKAKYKITENGFEIG